MRRATTGLPRLARYLLITGAIAAWGLYAAPWTRFVVTHVQVLASYDARS